MLLKHGLRIELILIDFVNQHLVQFFQGLIYDVLCGPELYLLVAFLEDGVEAADELALSEHLRYLLLLKLHNLVEVLEFLAIHIVIVLKDLFHALELFQINEAFEFFSHQLNILLIGHP